eukprot:8240173-Alexandrium_andersonii.AAC.1
MARLLAPTGCPTSSSISAATSLLSWSAKPSAPAGWGTTGWNPRWGRTSSCSSGFPRKGVRWMWTSSGRSCFRRR